MIHHTSAPSDGWAYYICNKKDRQRQVANACKSRRINERRADKAVLDTVLNRILTPTFLEDLIEETRLQMTDTVNLDREIIQKKTTLEGLDRAIQHLLDLVEGGDMDNSDAIARLKQRQAERARAQSEIKILAARRDTSTVEITPEAVSLILDTWRGQFVEVKGANDPRALRSLLARFVVKIELGYRQGRIWYTYPIDGNNTREQVPNTGAYLKLKFIRSEHPERGVCHSMVIILTY